MAFVEVYLQVQFQLVDVMVVQSNKEWKRQRMELIQTERMFLCRNNICTCIKISQPLDQYIQYTQQNFGKNPKQASILVPRIHQPPESIPIWLQKG